MGRSGLNLREIGRAAESVHPGWRDQQASDAATCRDAPFCQNNGPPGIAAMLSGQLHASQALEALPQPDVVGPTTLSA